MKIRLQKGQQTAGTNNENVTVHMNQEKVLFRNDLKRENKSLRTADSKVLVLPNGNYRKVYYSQPVHYYNEEQKCYRSIDNRLEAVADGDKCKYYETRYNSHKVRVAADTSANKLMEITQGIYKISWGLYDNQKQGIEADERFLRSYGGKVNRYSVGKIRERKDEKKERALPENLDGEITYADAFDGADLQYVVKPSSVKENIIVKEQSEKYEYSFKLRTENLTVRLSADQQSIEFKSVKEENKIIFSIPTPYMEDKAGRISSEVYYDIEDMEENTYLFKITANESWLNVGDRTFPVVIDPMIVSNQDGFGSVQYSFLNSKNNSQWGIVGKTDKGINRICIRPTFPDLGQGVIIRSVKLNASYGDKTANFKGVSAHRLTSNRDLDSLTFANVQYEKKALDLAQFLPDNVMTIDLTEYYENLLYKGKYDDSVDSSDYGIMLKMLEEDQYENSSVDVNGEFNIAIDYRIESGTRKGQMFISNEAGRGGTSQLNLRTGALKLLHKDISVPGNRFPVEIYHMYDSYLANGGLNLNGSADGVLENILTDGWKINYQQYLIPESYSYGRGGYIQRYRYIDGDGVTHYLERNNTGGYGVTFSDEDGLGLSIRKDYVSSWSPDAVMYDSQGNCMKFNFWRLSEIVKRNGDKTTIEYREASDCGSPQFYQISKISFGNGKSAEFTYTQNRLTQIQYNGEQIKYGYTYSGQIETITYPDGNSTKFYYTDDGALASVKDVSGKTLSFSYKSGNPFMVEKVEESTAYSKVTDTSLAGPSLQGDSLTVEYKSKNLVRTVNHKNLVKYYSFDNDGNVVGSWENEETASISPIRQAEYSGKDPARSVSASISYSEENLLNVTNSSPTINMSVQNTDQRVFVGGLKNLTSGAMYVLSGFAKGDSATIDEEDSMGENRTFELQAVLYNGNIKYATYSAKFDTRNVSEQLAMTAFKIPVGVTRLEIFASYENNINQAQFSHIRVVKKNAAVTERKVVFNNAYANGVDISLLKTIKYKVKEDKRDGNENSEEHTISKNITFPDLARMLQQSMSGGTVTLRANNSPYLVEGAYDVKFVVQNKTYSLSELDIKGVTTTETGEVERVNNRTVPYTDPLYFYRPEDGEFKQFRLSDITGISYSKRGMIGPIESISKSQGARFTEEDIKKTIYCIQTGQRVIFYNNGNYKSVDSVYYVWFETTKGSVFVRSVDTMYKTEVKRIIHNDGNYFTQSTMYNTFGEKEFETDIRGLVTEYEYDNYGNVTLERKYKNGDKSVTMEKKYVYENGDYLIKEYDEKQNAATTSYNGNGLPSSTLTPEGQSTSYEYTDNKDLKSMSSTLSTDNSSYNNKNEFFYNADYLTCVSHNGLDYTFEYSGFGDITAVYMANQKILTRTKTRNKGKVGDSETQTEVDTNYTQRVDTDCYGNTTDIYRNDVSCLENTYNASKEKLLESIDKCAGITYNYEYDSDGEVNKITYTGARTGAISTTKDGKKRVATQTHSFESGAETLSYSYTYEKNESGAEYPDGEVSSVNMTGKFTQVANKDAFGRVKNMNLNGDTGFAIRESYIYQKYDAVRTTPFVQSVTYTIGQSQGEYFGQNHALGMGVYASAESEAVTQTDSYTYDRNGNIQTITTAGKTISYSYDGLNRLTQEINNVTGKKYNYTYDAGGNILTKKITNLSTGATELSLNYNYDNTVKDRLISVGGDTISGYDLQGRPTNYRGTSLQWTNGRVTKFTKNNTVCNCDYDVNGIRIQKTENGNTHKYYLEDSNIVREVVTGNKNYELYFLYGLSGVVGFTYKLGDGTSANYYYRKNMLGDVLAVYDDEGTKCAEYAYDAWGNCTVLQNVNGIATLNPFRYRGYYWDNEINLYYLNARYYDPEIGRFISQDSIKYIAPETLNGLNLYAYCLNNPVMETDPDGTVVFSLGVLLVGALIGFAISFTTSVITQVATTGTVDWGIAAVDGVFGAISGALSTLPIYPVVGVLLDMGLTALNGIITTGISNEWQFKTSDWIGIAYTSIISGLCSSVSAFKKISISGTKQFNKAVEMTNKIGGRFLKGNYTKATLKGTMTATKSAFKLAGKTVVEAFSTQQAKASYLISFLLSIHNAFVIAALERIF